VSPHPPVWEFWARPPTSFLTSHHRSLHRLKPKAIIAGVVHPRRASGARSRLWLEESGHAKVLAGAHRRSGVAAPGADGHAAPDGNACGAPRHSGNPDGSGHLLAA